MIDPRRQPSQGQIRVTGRARDLGMSFAPGRGSGQRQPWRGRSGQPPKGARSRRQDVFLLDGADDHQRERRRHVVPAVEAQQLLARQPLDDVGTTDHRTPIGMVRERRGIELPDEEASGVVLAESHLLEHHPLLTLEGLGVEAGVDADVRERLDPRQRPRCWQHHVIEGVVERRPSVHPAAHALDVALDEPVRPRRRPFEEHVFEVVREPQLRRCFVATAGLHPELERDDVTGAVFLDHDAHSVRQHVAGRRRAHRRRWHGSRDGARACRQDDEQRKRDARLGRHAFCQGITSGGPSTRGWRPRYGA